MKQTIIFGLLFLLALATSVLGAAGDCTKFLNATSGVTACVGGNAGIGNFTGPAYATTLNTGQGNFELYAMNQNVSTTSPVTFTTLNTGQGNYELYAMNQNVQSSDMVQFARITLPGSNAVTYDTFLSWSDNNTYFRNPIVYIDYTAKIGTLNVTGAARAATLDTGQGAYELYAMNQNVQTSDAVTFASVNTGFGANELYGMNQNVTSTSAVTFATVNTGFGANELYAMNQNVTTTSNVVFNTMNSTGAAIATSLNTGFGANELYGMNQNVTTTSPVSFANVTLTAGNKICFDGATCNIYTMGNSTCRIEHGATSTWNIC